ncbi:extracellular scp domain containing protein [Niveomyces insectorum RCEF 264]|uniref:Extracellular scp domain containing protein n=1 Tax=Niveomyces insectorum RCEF 264 TaxID=1081102 RepID=A0A167STF9_9HYPO|nr:extracellular scp domain containing protein [Niveomyces insectorum RCEF 264]
MRLRQSVLCAACLTAVAATQRSASTTPGSCAAAIPAGVVHSDAPTDRAVMPVEHAATAGPLLPSTAPQFVSSPLFISAVLNSTNTFRREHNATAVVWNVTLAAYASSYLSGRDSACVFAHSGGPYGENIAIGFADVTSCVDAWGNERHLYDYSKPGFSEATGHFTQLVWKTTTSVGCGRTLCRGSSNGQINTGWFFVCEYWPRGNVIGEFATEVNRQIESGGGGGDGGRPESSFHGGSSTDQATGPPSSAVITGAVVVLVITVAAFCHDVFAAGANVHEHRGHFLQSLGT